MLGEGFLAPDQALGIRVDDGGMSHAPGAPLVDFALACAGAHVDDGLGRGEPLQEQGRIGPARTGRPGS